MKYMTSTLAFLLLLSSSYGDVLAARKLPPTEESCVERDIRAKEIATGTIEIFPSSCRVPEGWIEMGRSGYSENIAVTKEKKETSLVRISVPESADDRKIFIVTNDYVISEANATITPSVKMLRSKSYSIAGVDSKNEGTYIWPSRISIRRATWSPCIYSTGTETRKSILLWSSIFPKEAVFKMIRMHQGITGSYFLIKPKNIIHQLSPHGTH